tara:strand:- start:3335 stop:3553 length:219 start_codon:yes stop_codon:yes gene_type:complete
MSKIATDILDKVLLEVTKEDNMTRIEKKLIEPLLYYTFNRLYPYLMITSVIFILTFLLALLILLLLIKQIRH